MAQAKYIFTYLARVERDITGGVTLHLVEDDTHVELHEGDEFVTVKLCVNPFAVAEEGDNGLS